MTMTITANVSATDCWTVLGVELTGIGLTAILVGIVELK
jgi:hypothetical protein